MDQYVIDFKIGVLYWDLMDLYYLIKDSNNDDLKDYLGVIKKQLNLAAENSINDEIEE